MQLQITSLLLLFGIFGVHAQESKAPIELKFPLACTLGEDCWTARYVSRGGENRDFACKSRTQVGHKGTDFVIADIGRMQKGVAVLAAAKGRVKGVRNNEPDISIHGRSKDAIAGKECGNGVFLEHEDGWSTQYCHMKQGSISVKVGDLVDVGTPIGEIGLSGETEYPHMHFSLRKDGARMDPFDGKLAETACDAQIETSGLWSPSIAHSPMALVSASLSAAPPTRTTVWQAPPKTISGEAPSLVLTGTVFGMRAGDKWHFKITRPDGHVFFENRKTFTKDKQFHYQFGGKKRPSGGFQKGVWTGQIMVERVLGRGETLYFQKDTSVIIE